jgi:hypothetical protein
LITNSQLAHDKHVLDFLNNKGNFYTFVPKDFFQSEVFKERRFLYKNDAGMIAKFISYASNIFGAAISHLNLDREDVEKFADLKP